MKTGLASLKWMSLLLLLSGCTVTRKQVFVDITRSSGTKYLGAGKGVALGDIDNDGDLDIYASVCYENDRLFLNLGDCRFIDVTRYSGVWHESDGHGCVFADYDNDGYVDLFTAAMPEGSLHHGNKAKYGHWRENKLYRNEGDGYFTDVTKQAGLEYDDKSSGCSFADYDNDGNLDLFVANYGPPSILYRNNGDGTFENVTKEAGVEISGDFYGCAFADMDGDHYPDLFVQRLRYKAKPGIHYFHNQKDGTFKELTMEAGLGETGNSCAIAIGDYDNDGDLDFYLGNTNKLYRNEGSSKFTDVTGQAGLGYESKRYRQRPTRGICFADIDNDGHLDLYIGGAGAWLYRNNGDGTFTDIGQKLGLTQRGIHGVAFGDLDDDGDLDMYGTNWGRTGTSGRFTLHRNDLNDSRYLKVLILGRRYYTREEGGLVYAPRVKYGTNRCGIGAKLYLYAAGHCGDPKYLIGYREVPGGYGTFTSGPLEQHFGLGRHRKCDLRVVFPTTGQIAEQKGVSRAQTLVVMEPPKKK